MLELQPDRRASASEMLAHEWLLPDAPLAALREGEHAAAIPKPRVLSAATPPAAETPFTAAVAPVISPPASAAAPPAGQVPRTAKPAQQQLQKPPPQQQGLAAAMGAMSLAARGGGNGFPVAIVSGANGNNGGCRVVLLKGGSAQAAGLDTGPDGPITAFYWY
jgi:hypothetical protein